jgi:Sulfatase
MLNANHIVGSHDVIFITLDTLRYDVAEECYARGWLPNLAAVLPEGGWERRHSPGSFTYSAHHAFFAGFLPTPETPGPHPRLFAAQFQGSETATADTFVYDAPTWVEALRAIGYYTACIGGVGFFNKQTSLARVLPSMFEASFWNPELGVTSLASSEKQVAIAAQLLVEAPSAQRVLAFINISAIHQPNHIFAPDARTDSPATQAAALRYVDRCLPPLLAACRRRGPSFWIVCSDHGTAYSEDSYHGHRLAHPVVWTVPYAHFVVT